MKKFLILIIVISFLISSCGTGEPESRTDFTIKNVSSHNVKLTVFNGAMPNQNIKDTIFLLDSNSEISYYYILDGEDAPISEYPLGPADSAYIIFNDNLRIIYRRDDLNPRNILDINSYDGGKVDDGWYQYKYSITNEDYDNATEIE